MFLTSFLRLLSATVAVTAIAACASASTLVRRDHGKGTPRGWSLHRRADPEAVLPLKFALTQSNLHNLDAYLLDVADPHSPNYGKHWTPEKVAETFRPSRQSVDTVRSWLLNDAAIEEHKIRLSPDSSAVHVDLTVSEAERLLGAQYYVYQSEDGREHVGCHQGYQLPEHVSKHVDIVWPTVHFGNPRLTRRAGKDSKKYGRPTGAPKQLASADAMAPGNCDKGTTLDCLRALYNFDYEFVSTDKNTVGVLELANNVFLQSDLDAFFKKYDPEQVGHKPIFNGIAGGHLNASATDFEIGEATMDLQLMMGLVGKKQDVLYYQVGQEEDLVSFEAVGALIDKFFAAIDKDYCARSDVQALGIKECGNKPRANVVSISYFTSFDVDDDSIRPVLERQCAEFGKLSLTGMTFLVSSGDNGVAGNHPQGTCDTTAIDVGDALTEKPGQFLPIYPASCPYVTAVGATAVTPGSSVTDPEAATFDFFSGGGFSNIFPRPSYQQRQVDSYLKNFAPPYPADTFNRTGRAYPDIAANGFPTVVVTGGQPTTSGGTSAAAPIIASLIAAVNDARIAAGKAPVGFINPALYSPHFAQSFNDIRIGANPACGLWGFPTAKGWDPVTGLGTPNFKLLLDRFMALP